MKNVTVDIKGISYRSYNIELDDNEDYEDATNKAVKMLRKDSSSDLYDWEIDDVKCTDCEENLEDCECHIPEETEDTEEQK